jgi:hypothetical protein
MPSKENDGIYSSYYYTVPSAVTKGNEFKVQVTHPPPTTSTRCIISPQISIMSLIFVFLTNSYLSLRCTHRLLCWTQDISEVI